MARLPDEEWLHHAKKLSVGSRTRVFHRREGRPNLVIGNEAGKWWAYCQSCKAGGVVEKDHVRITGGSAPASSTHLDLPRDSTPILELDEFSRDAVLRLLAEKNMDQMYLPPIHFSEQRKRMLIDTGQGWLGRDTTGHSPQKWLTYDGTLWLGPNPGDVEQEAEGHGSKRLAVCVEDPFSFYKVRWALRDVPTVSTYCGLGTVLRPALRLHLLNYPKVVCFFDGDPAGVSGAKRESAAMRGLGVRSVARCAPDGFDPKDLSIDDIRSFINEL